MQNSFNFQLSIVNFQLSILNLTTPTQKKYHRANLLGDTFNCQFSIINYQFLKALERTPICVALG